MESWRGEDPVLPVELAEVDVEGPAGAGRQPVGAPGPGQCPPGSREPALLIGHWRGGCVVRRGGAEEDEGGRPEPGQAVPQ